MPVACSIASGNFAGCAVAIATIGTPGSAQARPAAIPIAVCGSAKYPEASCNRRISASVPASSSVTPRNSDVARRHAASGTGIRPSARNRAITAAVAAPSCSSNSNSNRSKFELT